MTDWAERDARREFHERVMADEAAAERRRLIEVVEAALQEDDQASTALDLAVIAVDALIADGVVFVRLGSCDD